jgi:hypothetical protein
LGEERKEKKKKKQTSSWGLFSLGLEARHVLLAVLSRIFAGAMCN